MKEKHTNIRKVRKIALYILLSLFVVALVLRVLLGWPAFQTWATSQIAQYINTEYNVQVQIDAVDIEWIDRVGLNGVYIEDHKKDTLAYIGELRVSIGELAFEGFTELGFPTVELADGFFNLVVYEGDSLSNLNVFVNRFGSSQPSDTTSKDMVITSSGLQLTNFRFRYENEQVPRQKDAIDWDHLDLRKINASLSDISIVNDTIDAHIQHLQCKDHSGFDLKQFSGLAHFNSVQTQVKDLVIETNKSYLALQLEFNYDSLGSYSEFMEEVDMNLKLDSVDLQMDDLGYFSSNLKGWNQLLRATGQAKGTVDNLTLRKFNLGFGTGSNISGNFDFNGLPNIEETFIMLNLKELNTTASDLGSFPDFNFPLSASRRLELPDQISRLRDIFFKGSFTGFINDFVAYGSFKTGLGNLKSDLNVSSSAASSVIAYTGKLSADQFQLGKLLESEAILGSTSFDLSVIGEGLDFESMQAELKGDVQSIEINKYRYQNIKLNGALKQRLITGDLALSDPNGSLQFNGSIDLSQKLPVMKFNATADSLALFALNLSERDSNALLSTSVAFNLTGNSVNNIVGTASLDSITYLENDKIYTLNKAQITGAQTSKGRKLTLQTDHLNGYVEGKFNTVQLPATMQYMAQDIIPNLFEVQIEKPDKKEVFDLQLKIGKESEFTELFLGVVDFKDDIDIKLSINSESRFIDFDLNTESIVVSGTELIKPHLYFHTANDSLKLNFDVAKGAISETRFVEDFHLNSIASNNQLNTQLRWENKTSEQPFSGKININSDIYGPQHVKVAFRDASFMLADTLWSFNQENYIDYQSDSVTVHQFALSNAESSLKMNGTIARDSNALMKVELNHFQLEYLNPFTEGAGFTFSGVLDGTTEFSSVYSSLILTSNNRFEKLVINKQEIGTGSIVSSYDNSLNKLTLNGGLYKDAIKTIGFSGYYLPKNEKNNIDLRIALDQFKLKLFNPILEEYVRFDDGTIGGNVSIKGEIDEPRLYGGFYTEKVKTHIVYLNTDYTIDQQTFQIRPDWVGADVLTLKDKNGNEAHANITIAHDNYSNLNFDIFLFDLKAFTVLNTKAGNGEMYYGNAYLSGYASISGTGDDLQIEGNLKTEKNTYLAIPLDGPENAEETPFIVFVGSEEKQQVEYEEQLDLTGIQMNFDLDVTPDAKIDIIFDKTVGDVISARGTGDLSLAINTNGTFNMFGTYETVQGHYLFTLENIINKKFQVLKGGIINWKGDPFEGKIDMRTEYSLRTSLHNLNIGGAIDSTAMRQRIPVSVFLDLKGNYMNPSFSFSFGLPSNFSEVEGILNNLEEGQRNKQAFTLLVLNSFLPIDGGAGSASTNNAIGKSSSEFLSNQLSNWLSQISDEFDVGVNYRPGDNISSDEVEVALSTQLFNDRVSIEGNFGVQGEDQGATQAQDNFIGDFQVEYKISEDGKLRGKIYNQTNANDLVNQNQSRYTQGVGVLYQEQFNTWAGFWCRVKQRFVSEEDRDQRACIELERERMLQKTKEKARKEEEIEVIED